jgi:quinol monooxygenase YgiN
MSEPIIYLDTSEVREGALEDLKAAIKELADLVEKSEPRILAYHVYLSPDGRRMTVLHLHRDSASLDFHLKVAGPAFQKFAELITLSSIHIYGRPSEKALTQLQEKARLLGSGEVVVHEFEAGVTRFAH